MAVAGSEKPVPYLDNIPYINKRKSRRLLDINQGLRVVP